MMRRGKSPQAFEDLAENLINKKLLDRKYKDHSLHGEFKDSRIQETAT